MDSYPELKENNLIERENEQNKKGLVSKILDFFLSYKNFFISVFITAIAAVFFLVIISPDFFSQNLKFFSLRWYGLGIVLTLCLFTYLVSFWSHWTYLKAVSIWLQSNVLSFFSFTYFLSVENAGFYPFIAVGLCVLIFAVNLNLFGKNQKKMYLLVPQVLLFTLQTYSFIRFLNVDRVGSRNFHDDFLNEIFSLSSIFWIFLCSLGVVFISVFNFQLKKAKTVLIASLVLFVLIFQMLIIINGLNFEFFLYWQKTLLFLIFWNFIFQPLDFIFNQKKDLNYTPKLVISTLYHVFLMLFVFIYPIIFTFILKTFWL